MAKVRAPMPSSYKKESYTPSISEPANTYANYRTRKLFSVVRRPIVTTARMQGGAPVYKLVVVFPDSEEKRVFDMQKLRWHGEVGTKALILPHLLGKETTPEESTITIEEIPLQCLAVRSRPCAESQCSRSMHDSQQLVVANNGIVCTGAENASESHR